MSEVVICEPVRTMCIGGDQGLAAVFERVEG
jgi:acetyl-CoA acetyltransferase